jgi:serine phosphatase RsbU (regulator of sigma subunit)/Tfp pilus assembly protein PilF
MLPRLCRFVILSVLLTGTPAHVLGQDQLENLKADSIQRLVEKTDEDSTKARLHNQLAESWLKKDNYKAIAEARKSLVFSRLSRTRDNEATSYFIIGAAYDNEERYSDALEYYFYALPIAEETGDTNLLLRNYNQIGIIYSYQDNDETALKYFENFTRLAEDLGRLSNMAKGYNNLGICYKNLGDYETAGNYYHKALEIFKEQNYAVGIISSYINLGVVAANKNDNAQAMDYYNKATLLAYRENNLYALSIAKVNLGEMYYGQKMYRKAIQEYDSSLILSEKINLKRQMKDAYDGLYKSYEKLGNYPLAFDYLTKYLATKDSIFKDETKQKLSLAEKNYEAVKAEKKFELKQKQDEILLLQQEKELAMNQLYIWALILVAAVVIISAFVLYTRVVEKKKANQLLQKQRDEIAHQKKEITDSISYAQRIQSAILPSHDALEKYFEEHFILFRPKDIVSGDFYWLTYHDNKLIVAAADCTGHGVPGALVSVICSTALSRSVREFNLTEPGAILDKTTELVAESFTKNESEVRDGMDISLCMFDTERKNLHWAGANNPVWIIRNHELTEIKGDKQPIGRFDHRKPFTSHKVSLEKGDVLYIFSDGFPDQFGGPDEKKFKYSNFKSLLKNISHESASIQKNEIEKIFEAWKGDQEQTDDVCVIGMKV